MYFNSASCRFVPISNYLQLRIVTSTLGEDLVHCFWNILWHGTYCTQPNTQVWNMKLISPHYIYHYWTEGVINKEIWRVFGRGSKLQSSHIKNIIALQFSIVCILEARIPHYVRWLSESTMFLLLLASSFLLLVSILTTIEYWAEF
jgi:hypothetical protein